MGPGPKICSNQIFGEEFVLSPSVFLSFKSFKESHYYGAVAHPDLKCYLRPSLSDRVSALIKIKPANQYKNQVENQETFVPPHPAVISREKQKNKKHRRRPITPKEMNKITTVSFLHTVHTQILKPSGQESFSILIYKRKKELKNTKTFIT